MRTLQHAVELAANGEFECGECGGELRIAEQAGVERRQFAIGRHRGVPPDRCEPDRSAGPERVPDSADSRRGRGLGTHLRQPDGLQHAGDHLVGVHLVGEAS